MRSPASECPCRGAPTGTLPNESEETPPGWSMRRARPHQGRKQISGPDLCHEAGWRTRGALGTQAAGEALPGSPGSRQTANVLGSVGLMVSMTTTWLRHRNAREARDNPSVLGVTRVPVMKWCAVAHPDVGVGLRQNRVRLSTNPAPGDIALDPCPNQILLLPMHPKLD